MNLKKTKTPFTPVTESGVECSQCGDELRRGRKALHADSGVFCSRDCESTHTEVCLAERRAADRIDGYDRDDLGESPDR